MQATLREAVTQRAIADLAVRYVFLIDGQTERGDLRGTSLLLVALGQDKWTDITATVWDVSASRNIFFYLEHVLEESRYPGWSTPRPMLSMGFESDFSDRDGGSARMSGERQVRAVRCSFRKWG